MCRDPQMWRRVVDEHNFAVDQQLSDEVRCRLQVLRCVHDDAVLLAVQNTGEGPSVINRAEDVAHTAQQRFLSGDGDGPPPDLVIRMHDARDDHMPWHLLPPVPRCGHHSGSCSP